MNLEETMNTLAWWLDIQDDKAGAPYTPDRRDAQADVRRVARILAECRAAGFIDDAGNVLHNRMYWRYDCDEGESPYDDLADISDACDVGSVFRVQVAVPLPDEYHVATVGDDGHSSSRPATPEEVDLWKQQREAWRNRASTLPEAAKEQRP